MKSSFRPNVHSITNDTVDTCIYLNHVILVVFFSDWTVCCWLSGERYKALGPLVYFSSAKLEQIKKKISRKQVLNVYSTKFFLFGLIPQQRWLVVLGRTILGPLGLLFCKGMDKKPRHLSDFKASETIIVCLNSNHFGSYKKGRYSCKSKSKQYRIQSPTRSVFPQLIQGVKQKNSVNFSKDDGSWNLNFIFKQSMQSVASLCTPQLSVTLTYKINRVHPLVIGNICTKYDQNTIKGMLSILYTRLFNICPLWPCPLT